MIQNCVALYIARVMKCQPMQYKYSELPLCTSLLTKKAMRTWSTLDSQMQLLTPMTSYISQPLSLYFPIVAVD